MELLVVGQYTGAAGRHPRRQRHREVVLAGGVVVYQGLADGLREEIRPAGARLFVARRRGLVVQGHLPTVPGAHVYLLLVE
jgi:hypothetical protein